MVRHASTMSSKAVDDLGAAVHAVACLDLERFTLAELQSAAGSVAGVMDRLGAVKARLLGELVGRGGGKVPGEPAADGTPGPAVLVQHWLRDLGNTGGPAAGRDVRNAALLRRMPVVLAAVTEGRLGLAQALLLTRFVDRIDAAALAEAEPNLVLVAIERDPQALALWVNDRLATWCEPQFDKDVDNQQAKRYLQTSRESDGMVFGRFRLPSAEGEALMTVIEPLARKAGDADDRTAGQRRADALGEVCEQVLRFGELPDAGGFRPQVSYVVPAGWAAGQSPVGSFAELVGQSLAEHVLGDLRAGIPIADSCPIGAWTGPQTRSLVETILCDARLTRVLLDSRGQVTGLEALGDTITKAQRRALAARDHGCVARGCHRPPAFCDAHHLDSRGDGGATSIDNLVLLCRRHHTLWHRGRLTLRQLYVPWITGTHDPPF